MILDRFSLAGKVAIVTGSCRGIGQALAVGLAQAGAGVTITCRDILHLGETERRIRDLGGGVHVVPGDVRNKEQVETIVQETVERFGRVDVLVNNAGGGGFQCGPEEMRERGWDAVVQVNLKGPFLFAQAVFPHMKAQQDGRIVNITSRVGRDSSPKMAHYGASKAALSNLTKSLALAWAPHGIRVNAVGPGATLTVEARQLLWDTPDKVAAAVQHISMGRMAEPEEMVGPVLFLASDASSFVNGQTLYVDGGYRR
jgi:NAD(P)-dependent dehydrogenase (short-subunit alcohol dehydrogenase family)